MPSSFSNLPNGYPTQHFPDMATPNQPAGATSRPPGRMTSAATTAATASSSSSGDDALAALVGDANFDIFDWFPAYQSCQRYFLDHAQYEGSVQAVAALMNISLPFQWTGNPILGSSGHAPATGPSAYGAPWQGPGSASSSRAAHPSQTAPIWVSLVPYIRRLVVTGFDGEGVVHGFFGDDWKKGVAPLRECERRNFLFAAKSVGWAQVKCQYDMGPHETVPFIRPLQNVHIAEIEGAEKTWSQWLAMEDWMLGERAPEQMDSQKDDPQVNRGT